MPYLRLALVIVAAAATLDGQAQKPPDTLSIGEKFHYETSFADGEIRSSRVRFGDSLPLYKSYPGADTVRLAGIRPIPEDLGSTLRRRRSTRRFTSDSLAFALLSTLLQSSCGITGARGGPAHRAVPSAGALYPIEVYVLALRVMSMPPGLYHFRPRDSILEFVRAGDLAADLFRASHEQSAASAPAAALVIAARFDRSTHKYGDRGYRYTYMEAGAICQNVYLLATALGIGTVAVGAFDDEAANRLVGLDGTAEAALILMPLGYPAEP